MNKHIILGVSGDPGSFSEEAGRLYAQHAGLSVTLDFLTDMEGVLAAVNASTVDLGIFPVVNSSGGLVTMAFAAMGKYLFTWLGEFPLNISQCLLVKRGVQMTQIKHVVSHPQGLAQCARYLQTQLPNAKTLDWQDTAKAACDLAEGRLDPHSAVIASERAAQIYGLEVLEHNIQDNLHNVTTFIIIKKLESTNGAYTYP